LLHNLATRGTKGGEAALRYCCTIAFFEVSEFYHLPHGAITPQYVAVLSPECKKNHDIKIANRSFENVAHFRYLGVTVTNQNVIQEAINRRLNSGNACYHSIQNLLSFHLLSKKIRIRIYYHAFRDYRGDLDG
jgi:hypothetical protein